MPEVQSQQNMNFGTYLFIFWSAAQIFFNCFYFFVLWTQTCKNITHLSWHSHLLCRMLWAEPKHVTFQNSLDLEKQVFNLSACLLKWKQLCPPLFLLSYQLSFLSFFYSSCRPKPDNHQGTPSDKHSIQSGKSATKTNKTKTSSHISRYGPNPLALLQIKEGMPGFKSTRRIHLTFFHLG